ncbi:MAG TPA: DegV family protein [Jiangellaceae bacterium]|nr:DegV family protein [Jiangellaceae bacterium]
MARAVAIVTDSTAYLDTVRAADADVAVVPLQVVLDGRSYEEGTTFGPRDLAEALRRRVRVSTSRPSPRAFLDAYEAAAASGAGGIVSVHISGHLSGTADAAHLAAHDSPVPVEVVDSYSLGMGLGYAVLAAAEAADRGMALDQVAEVAQQRALQSSAFFYVDTLEYLRRGGRIGAAAALLGTAFAVKPLLHLDGGVIQPLEKVRTSARAVARLEELALERAGEGPVDVAVHHLDNAERAGGLAERLRARLPSLGQLLVSEVGAVIGAHVGPGLLAVVVSPH